MKKMKVILSFLLVFILGLFFVACGNDEGDKKPDEGGEETPVVLTQEEKEAAVNELKEFVNSFNASEYSTDNWNTIQSLLLNTTINIMSAQSKTEINNYVSTFKSTVALVQKKPIEDIQKEQEVSEEVWEYIINDLENASKIEDYSFKYDSQLPSIGGANSDITNSLNMKLNGVILRSEKSYYVNFEGTSKVKAWVVTDEKTKLSTLYFDAESEDLNGKYYIGYEELKDYIEGELDLLPEWGELLPGVGEFPSLEDLLPGLGTKASPMSYQKTASNGLPFTNIDDLAKKLIEILKESSESKMWIDGDITTVSVYVNKEKVGENNPELKDYLNVDLDITITLNNNHINKIIIKPVAGESEDNSSTENNSDILSMIDRVQVSFTDEKISSIYAFTKILNADASIGMKFDYVNTIIPSFNKDEFQSFNYEEYKDKKEFKEAALELLDLHALHQLNIPGETFEEFVAKHATDELIMYLIKHKDLKIYVGKTVVGLVPIYHVGCGEYLCSYTITLTGSKVEMIDDLSLIETLETKDFDIMKVIEYR